MNVWKEDMWRQIRYWKEKGPKRVARKEKMCVAASNGWRDGPHVTWLNEIVKKLVAVFYMITKKIYNIFI